MLKRILPLILSIFFLCAFTGFSKDADLKLEDIRGNPDPEVGVVFKLDDTAPDIMAASSDNIRFRVDVIDGNRILGLNLPIDFKPKKLTLVDKRLGFTGEVFRPFFHFSRRGTILAAYFYPFDPSEWRTKQETQPYLDKWVKIFDDAGWARKVPSPSQTWWEPLTYPTEKNLFQNNYMVWNCPNEACSYKIVMLLEMADPLTYGKRFTEPKYSISIRIEEIIRD